MARKDKVCRSCRVFVEKDTCPLCGGTDFGTTWAGVAIVLDQTKSEVAKKMEVSVAGKYALKVR